MISKLPSRPYLRNEVYEALRRHVLSLAAGIEQPVKLREEDMARALGVSRTPVREALRKLEQEGFVRLQPHRGAWLMPVALDEYLEWLEIREMVEGLAARLAAEKATASEVEQLRAIFAGYSESTVMVRAADYAQANVAFHAMVAELAGNKLLIKTWNSFGHASMAGLRFIERLGRGPQSLAEHQLIIDTIATRNPDAAEHAARNHIRALRISAQASLTSYKPEQP